MSSIVGKPLVTLQLTVYYKKEDFTMNDVFEKISKNLTGAGKAVTEKTKQVSESAKLNAKIVSSEHTISENYAILGKFYYETYKSNPDDEVAEAVNSITAAMDAITEMKAQLLSIKGSVLCAACGAECPIESNFCPKCGSVLEKPQPVSDEAETVSADEVVVEETTAEEPTATADDSDDDSEENLYI